MPRIDASSLRPGSLVEEVVAPAVLTNLAECWPARHCWSHDYLARVHGDISVAQLRLPEELFKNDLMGAAAGNALYADHARNVYVPFARPPEQLELRELIQHRFDDYYFEIGEDGAAGRLCFDAFGGLEGLPAILAADDLSQLTFGLGPAGDGVMFHAHTAAWNALMFGTKEWLFYPPDGFDHEIYDQLAMLEARAIPGALEQLAGKIPIRCTQQAGEVVWIPDGWWHATFSHSDTGCLGGQRHKDRLPTDWGESLLRQWPGCGLALNAVAKIRREAALFEAAVRQEPFNLRFVIEHLNFLRDRAEWQGMREIAMAHRDRMTSAQHRGLLARPELAALLAQLAERLYHAVEGASEAAVQVAPGGADRQMATFQEAIRISQVAHTMISEALALDPGSPLATSLAEAIEVRAASATQGRDLRSLTPQALAEVAKVGLKQATLKRQIAG